MANIIFTPIALCLRFFKIIILPINVSQIGNVIWLDCFLRENRQNNKKYRLIIVPASTHIAANPYLLSLYSDHVYLAKNLFEYLILFNLWINPFCTDSLIRFDAGGSSLDVHKTLGKDSKNKKPIIKMSENDQLKALNLLSPIGLNLNDKFVVLHVRDSGYYQDYKKSRNANVDNYMDAIKYILKKGYKVVLLGSHKSIKLRDSDKLIKDGFIDYAHSGLKKDFIDIFLMSNCEFLLGTDSGPAFVVPLFHKNVIMTNAMPPSRSLWFLEGDLSIFKKIKSLKTKKLIELSEILSPKFYELKQIKNMEKLGYEVIENSNTEILDAVVEFFHPKKNISHSNMIKKTTKLGCRNYDALGNFSNSFLELNFFNDANK